MNCITSVSYTHLLIKYVYKYQDEPTQRSVLAEYIAEVDRLIDVLDIKKTEITDWRSVYKDAARTTTTTKKQT